VVLACIAAMLCTSVNASALERVQTKTRVWDFSSAAPLNTWLERSATPRTHPENPLARSEPASASPHAARAAPKAIDPNKLHHIFGQAKHKLGPLLEKFGGSQEAAFRAVESATQTAARNQGLTGVFKTTVEVGGQNVVVKGTVIDGTARIGSFWIP